MERLLESDPENPSLEALRAEIHFRRRQWRRVIDAAAEALGLVWFNPRLHLILGLALAREGRRDDAINELHVALRQNPAQPRALAALERLHAHDPLRALDYRRRAADLRERLRALRDRRRAAPAAIAAIAAIEYAFHDRCAAAVPDEAAPLPADAAVIVSGLPRSGTSMLMRVLEAGGMPLLVDSQRAADENNRLGYYEYEPVKGTPRDASWARLAAGKAVKVVAPLLRHLPPALPARILLLHRPLSQVIGSQEAMKGRLGTTARGTTPDVLARQYAAEMEGIDALVVARPAWRVLHVAYESMLADPEAECRRIGAFLGGCIDAAAAARGVDAGQRRFT